ncbi:MAG TPA: hypothetical protein VE987_10315, partial [Polyangiaceae bacterium]|nr:hypothetical protein [Polyangiaceae bacterium]
MRAACAVLTACYALTGCASHADLIAPPPSAPLRSRLAAYDELKSLSYHSTTVTTYGSFGSSTTRSTDYMQLANGTRVYYPEDILPVVPEGSAPANAAEASKSKRDLASVLALTSALSIAGGLALTVLSFTSGSSDSRGTPIAIGLGVALGGGLGFGLAARFVGASAQDEAATAYETYDHGLLERLHLCEIGNGVDDCG